MRIRRQVDPEQEAAALAQPAAPANERRRQLERARLAELLDSKSLVTLVGPVGVGNTHHALEACAEQTEARPDGVWLVELAPLSDANLEAAESICLVSGCATLDVLGQLIDKSLVQTDSQADGSDPLSNARNAPRVCRRAAANARDLQHGAAAPRFLLCGCTLQVVGAVLVGLGHARQVAQDPSRLRNFRAAGRTGSRSITKWRPPNVWQPR